MGSTIPITREQPVAFAEVKWAAPLAVRVQGLLKVPAGAEERITYEGREIARLAGGDNQLSIPMTITRPESTLRFELVDAFTGQPFVDHVVMAAGFHLADTAAHVLLDLAASWAGTSVR